MAVYDGICPTCGIIEIRKLMNDPWPHCPMCGSKDFSRVITVPRFNKPADQGWEGENDGLGRYLPQAGKQYLDPYTKTKLNPDAHARSRNEAIEIFKKKGAVEISKF